MAESKTNAARLFDAAHIPYEIHSYETGDGLIDGVSVAEKCGQDPERVFKTLVTVGHSGEHYVFVVPVAENLDLKKAAKAVKEKSIEMIRQKELLPLTGYVHGGCSPFGMKKPFRTVFEETAMLYDTIMVSAGKIGLQIEAAPDDMIALLGEDSAAYGDITKA
ncbi:MAG: Cys-tRNA(Pro) deacylase [Bacillota bacterium]|jgi:Cys-tRNA(Pro)/Cys-tRNA(Cys) deacylase